MTLYTKYSIVQFDGTNFFTFHIVNGYVCHSVCSSFPKKCLIYRT